MMKSSQKPAGMMNAKPSTAVSSLSESLECRDNKTYGASTEDDNGVVFHRQRHLQPKMPMMSTESEITGTSRIIITPLLAKRKRPMTTRRSTTTTMNSLFLLSASFASMVIFLTTTISRQHSSGGNSGLTAITTVLAYSSPQSQSRSDRLSGPSSDRAVPAAVVVSKNGDHSFGERVGVNSNKNEQFFFSSSSTQHYDDGINNNSHLRQIPQDVVTANINGKTNGYHYNEIELNAADPAVTVLLDKDGHKTEKVHQQQDMVNLLRNKNNKGNIASNINIKEGGEYDVDREMPLSTPKASLEGIINGDRDTSVVNGATGEASGSDNTPGDMVVQGGKRWYQKPLKSLFGRIRGCDDGSEATLSENNGFDFNSSSTYVDASDIVELSDSKRDNDKPISLRRLWRRRHARTLEEGIRRERRRAVELSQILDRVQIDARQGQERSYVERTLMGLLNALAEEIEDLDIDFSTVPKTPLWRKEVEEIRINFSRLGFRPLRMGGVNATVRGVGDLDESTCNVTLASKNSADAFSSVANVIDQEKVSIQKQTTVELSLVESADEAFDRIDGDGSGTLDRDEIAQALSSISALETDRESIEELANSLVELYDLNGDGVVDREEYQKMVEDMAKIRPVKHKSETETDGINPFTVVKDSIQSVSEGISKKAVEVASAAREKIMNSGAKSTSEEETEMGSIVLSNLTLDLRRLIFGALPFVKKVAPGGPLILEPFTATVTASFSREDVMGSFLLDAGLRRLVARALRVRVRAFRDGVDGALFFGRQWKMTSETAPVVDVLGLSNVEFDSRDRMVITGRARIRTSPDAPTVEQTFKLRSKIGTRKNGQVIRLVEPELAFVFECPEALESLFVVFCQAFGLAPPDRPEPYYSFFPIYSPFKVSDNDGFDMGEDNCLRSVYIKKGKLRFEMSAVLRPGRFLGSHYVAFTVPQRTFILTMDRVFEGIRAARENKRIAARAKKLKEKEIAAGLLVVADDIGDTPEEDLSLPVELSSTESSYSPAQPQLESPPSRLFRTIRNNQPKPKSFFARFVEGYTLIEREVEANNDRLTNEISDWFGRQGRRSNSTASSLETTPSTNNNNTTTSTAQNEN